jgi:CRP-like cAMP-binding protein
MALLTGAARNADVVALTPTPLLRLDVIDFRSLAAKLPDLLRIIGAESAARIRDCGNSTTAPQHCISRPGDRTGEDSHLALTEGSS